jgi:hypothetical protein
MVKHCEKKHTKKLWFQIFMSLKWIVLIEWNKILETELGEIKKSFSWPLKNIP